LEKSADRPDAPPNYPLTLSLLYTQARQGFAFGMRLKALGKALPLG
jgi:hypothetical protein